MIRQPGVQLLLQERVQASCAPGTLWCGWRVNSFSKIRVGGDHHEEPSSMVYLA